MADTTFSVVELMVTSVAPNVFSKSGIHVPDGGLQTLNGTEVGEVVVTTSDQVFVVNGLSFSGAGLFVYTDPLTARK